MSYDEARMLRMKPVLDRMPKEWGKYLPGPGWDDLLLELDGKLAEIDPDYVIHQAKEKFGELRFYFHAEGTDSHDDALMGNLVTMAEHKSSRTCESCGADGAKARHTGWIKTLCDDCHEERSER
jgi:hypothetical protein